MIRGAATQNEYFGGQAVEARNVHNGRETWRPARIHRRTSRGCQVIYRDGDQRPQHIMFSDLRPLVLPSERPKPKVATPLLTAADIDAYNARMEKEERERREAEGAKPQPQALVLVRPNLKPPVLVLTASGRRQRQPKEHRHTPLSELLRKTRTNRGMQQGVLGERTKIKRLSAIEFGDVDPTDDELLELSGALDLDLDRLLALRDGPPAAEEPSSRVVTVAPPPLPAPEPPPLMEAIQTPPKPVTFRGFSTEDMERLVREIAALREENTILRETVIFYAGMDR